MFGMIFRVAFTFRVASSEYFIGETRSRNWCGKSVRMIKIGETAGSRIEEEDFYLEFPDSFRGISIVNIREEYLRGREVPPLTFPWIFVRLLRKKKNRNPDIFHSVHSYYKLKIEYIYIHILCLLRSPLVKLTNFREEYLLTCKKKKKKRKTRLIARNKRGITRDTYYTRWIIEVTFSSTLPLYFQVRSNPSKPV